MVGNIINRLKNYYLEIFVISVGLLHQLIEKVLQFSLPWFDQYGDDLLAVPFVSSCVLLMENFIFYKQHDRKHSFLQLLFLFFLISIFFEFVAPKYTNAYTFDWIDIVYYFIGFISFYLIQKKPHKRLF